MRRMQRIVLIAVIFAAAPVLAGCADFDMDKLDIFGINEKKKLPGDRKPLFPEGVPGVTQGIPPEFVKGNQPPPENAEAAPLPAEPPKAAAAVDPDEKSKPKRKVKVAKQKLIPDNNPPPTQNQQTAPAQNQQQQQTPQQSSSAPWPSSGTTAR